MNRLVVIRTADAYESLGRIRAALRKASGRRSDATLVAKDLSQLAYGGRIPEIGTLIDYCALVLKRKSQSDWTEFERKLTAGQEAFTEVKKQLAALVNSADSLTKGSSNEDQLKMHKGKTNDLVDNKEIKLDEITEKAAQYPPPPPFELLRQIEDAKPMWAEHLETIAGMVLRDDRFDDGLCALADQIVAICAEFGQIRPDETLNILGRDNAITKELNYAVYFRFPAWSVWGLALIAHEFWHASCVDITELKSALTSIAGDVWPEPLVQDCLADTFATYVMGPAYAFACTLLLLDVHSPQDRVRAQIVFSTLDHLAAESSGYDFRRDLQECWDEAARGQETKGNCLLMQASYPCHLVTDFAKTFMRNAGRTPLGQPNISCRLADATGHCPMMDTVLIEKLHRALLTYMNKKAKKRNLRYNTDNWNAVSASLDDLFAKPAPSNDADVFSDDEITELKEREADLRHVLHFAWMRRWKGLELDSSIELIGRRAHQLCDRLIPSEERVPIGRDPNDPK